jgi:hypothetical protein
MSKADISNDGLHEPSPLFFRQAAIIDRLEMAGRKLLLDDSLLLRFEFHRHNSSRD